MNHQEDARNSHPPRGTVRSTFLFARHGDNVSDIDPFVYTDVPLKEIRSLKVVDPWAA